MDHKELIDEIRKKTARTGGWDKPTSWGRRKGLTRYQVDQWMTRGDIPKGWKTALEALLG